MKNKKTIGINGFFLNKPNTGIGKYTRDILLNAAKKLISCNFILFINEPFDNNFDIPKNIEIKHIPFIGFGSNGAKKTIWEQLSLPRAAKRLNIDILLSPYPSQPWYKSWYKNKIYTISVIHDCIPWKYKSYRTSLLSKMYHAQTLKSAKLCDEIWTVSKTSKKEISDICGVDGSKIKVFHNCVSQEYTNKYTNDEKLKVLKKFKLKKYKYFLYVGGYDNRKNVKNLILGFEKFKNDTAFNHKLVLAGGKILTTGLYNDFDHASNLEIIKTGFVTNMELAILYQCTSGFFSVSKDEGFNIPSIEALFSNCPINLSDIKVHNEIIGDVANFINIEKNSIQNISNCFIKTLNIPETKRENTSKHKSKLMIKYNCKNASKEVQNHLKKILKLINE